jgi:tetratricopeptide (TPR) repeat protein
MARGLGPGLSSIVSFERGTATNLPCQGRFTRMSSPNDVLMADWYRSTGWSEQIEAEFFRRLKRPRDQKPQYLVIQASTLLNTRRPEAASTALTLIDRFFAEHYQQLFVSDAFQMRADALLLLERWEDGFHAFEDALAARRAFPNVINNAWLDYPLTVARRRARHRYDRALQVLKEFVSPTALVFPIQEFQYFAALALISADQGDREGAARSAHNALAAAARQAPFVRHPGAGLVDATNSDLKGELEQLAGNGASAIWPVPNSGTGP